MKHRNFFLGCAGITAFAFITLNANAMNNNFSLKSYKNESEFIHSSYDDKQLFDTSESTEKLKKGCIIVNVKTVCDQDYQKKHKSDWTVRAKKIVRQSTKVLYNKYNIMYYPAKAIKWSSPNTNDWEKIYNDARSKFNFKNTKKMLVAFSGKKTGGVAGISKTGKKNGPHIVVFASSYKSEIETAQHEIGHVYGLKHCNNNCVMRQSGFGYLNKFCAEHESLWKQNRKYY